MRVRLTGGFLLVFMAAFLGVAGADVMGGTNAASAQPPLDDERAIVTPSQEALVGGTVTFVNGTPVVGLVVDFFEATADGSRGRFLGDVETGPSGVFSRSISPGCYVLTYIAPDGRTFVGGGRYFQIGICVEPGEKRTDLNAHLASDPKQEALVGGLVRFVDGTPVVGLVVDFFEANPDGARGTWLGDELTDQQGRYSRAVKPRCYVLVFIAPASARFVKGGEFLEASFCVKQGAEVSIGAELEPTSEACRIQDEVVSTPLAQTECDALLAFYHATNGPNWGGNLGWNTATDPCTWIGIGCVGGELQVLSLFDFGLTGSLPSELGQLADLQILELARNGIAGSIPAELGRLENLRYLLMRDNMLSGAIPPELGQIDGLAFVELGGNELSGAIPLPLLQTDLAYLNLGDNQMTGSVPAELGQVTTLFGLTLGGNQLTGQIPPGLGQLPNLHLLDLGGNRLSGPIPPELGQLANLDNLDLSGNRLSGPIPSSLGNSGRLVNLDLGTNELTGSIPPELGQLSNMTELNVGNNLLSGDITAAMAGLRQHNTIQTLGIGDETGGNNCMTVTDAALAEWLSALSPGWDECE